MPRKKLRKGRYQRNTKRNRNTKPIKSKAVVMLRLGRRRKPETLQSHRERKLQPWIEFSGLLGFATAAPFPWEASAEFLEQFFAQHAGLIGTEAGWSATRFPATLLFFPSPVSRILDRRLAAREFYSLFWTVRSTFEWIIDTWATRKDWPEPSLEIKFTRLLSKTRFAS